MVSTVIDPNRVLKYTKVQHTSKLEKTRAKLNTRKQQIQINGSKQTAKTNEILRLKHGNYTVYFSKENKIVKAK